MARIPNTRYLIVENRLDSWTVTEYQVATAQMTTSHHPQLVKSTIPVITSDSTSTTNFGTNSYFFPLPFSSAMGYGEGILSLSP